MYLLFEKTCIVTKKYSEVRVFNKSSMKSYLLRQHTKAHLIKVSHFKTGSDTYEYEKGLENEKMGNFNNESVTRYLSLWRKESRQSFEHFNCHKINSFKMVKTSLPSEILVAIFKGFSRKRM
jgi:hypothetical protein